MNFLRSANRAFGMERLRRFKQQECSQLHHEATPRRNFLLAAPKEFGSRGIHTHPCALPLLRWTNVTVEIFELRLTPSGQGYAMRE